MFEKTTEQRKFRILALIVAILVFAAFIPFTGMATAKASKKVGTPSFAKVSSVKYSVKKKAGGSVAASWGKAKNAKKYSIQVFKKNGKKYKKYGKTKSASKTKCRISVSQNGTYRYLVKGTNGKRSGKARSSKSWKVKNTVYGWKAPRIKKQPKDQIFAKAYSDPEFKFSITATGTKIRYQWYKIENGKSKKLAGRTKTSFTAHEEGSYYCIVKSKAGSVKSKTVKAAVKTAEVLKIKNTGKTLTAYYDGSYSDYIFKFNNASIRGNKSWIIHASDYKNGSIVKISSKYKDGDSWYTGGAVFAYKVNKGKFVFSSVSFE